ncbi:hypothetical protein QUF80_19890 [Desulfococcaceae bacterium HSG8]|nr:hypothetical protein [Desulfococcaceae bacterium HSG8]
MKYGSLPSVSDNPGVRLYSRDGRISVFPVIMRADDPASDQLQIRSLQIRWLQADRENGNAPDTKNLRETSWHYIIIT